jgi:hypothetical protein
MRSSAVRWPDEVKGRGVPYTADELGWPIVGLGRPPQGGRNVPRALGFEGWPQVVAEVAK